MTRNEQLYRWLGERFAWRFPAYLAVIGLLSHQGPAWEWMIGIFSLSPVSWFLVPPLARWIDTHKE